MANVDSRTPNADAEPPLLVAATSRAALRRKLTASDSPLAPWWRHFLALARGDEAWYREYAVLAALVTDDTADRERAVAALMTFVAAKAAGDTSQDAQFHTHVTEAPLARWAIQADWALDQGWLQPEQATQLADAMLEHAMTFALPNLQSRYREFDNQILSNAIGAAAVGYVWGLHHGDDARGRTLYDAGMARLRTLFALLPAGGYSYEGSAYQQGVVTPLIALAGRFYQEMTGLDVFRQGLRDGDDAGPPLTKVLTMSWRIIGPAAVCPGWDDYGFSRAAYKMGLVMLARVTGDARPLATIRELGMWYRNSLPAWGHDDRVWSLLWWPDELEAVDAAWPAWMEPSVGGALQDAKTRTRLLQYWDHSGGPGQSGRCQVDANTITLEAHGSPLVLDGHFDLPPELYDPPMETILAQYEAGVFTSWQDYARSTWNWEMPLDVAVRRGMAGSLAYGNGLIFGDADWYIPETVRWGFGQALHAVGPLQALRADVSAMYHDLPGQPVRGVDRASLLVDGRYTLVCDHVEFSEDSSAITWQAYLRQAATALGPDRVSIETPERVRCEVIFGQAGELELTPIDGQPKDPAAGSMRCRYRIAEPARDDAGSIRVDVALVPQAELRELADISGGWTRTVDGDSRAVSLQQAWLDDPTDAPDAARIFEREVELEPEDLAHGVYLTLEDGGPDVGLTVNGKTLTPILPSQPHGHWRTTGVVPLVWDLRGVAEPGINTLRLSAVWYHGETLRGPCRLMALKSTAPVDVTREGVDSFRVRIGDGEDRVLIGRVDGLAPWAGGETDAHYATWLADGRVAAAACTHLTLPELLTVHGEGPADFAWSPTGTTLDQLTPQARYTLRWGDSALSVELGGTLRVAWYGPDPHRLQLRLDQPIRVWLNGQDQGLMDGDLTLDLQPTIPITPDRLASPADVYLLLDRSPVATPAAASLLMAALQAHDWRLQVAAAEACGRLLLHEAVQPLLAIFEAEGRDLNYPELKYWWSHSRMYRNPGAVDGHDTSLPEPIATKRWRLRLAVVGALGRIGDLRALQPMEDAFRAGRDFFPVMAELAVAIGRLGQASSLPLLQQNLHHAEANTRSQVNAAYVYIVTGATDRARFERAIR